MCLPVMYLILEADEILPMMQWMTREFVEERRMIPVMPFDDVLEISYGLSEC